MARMAPIRTELDTPELRKNWSTRLPVALLERLHEFSYVSRAPIQDIVERAITELLDREYPVSVPRTERPARPAPRPTPKSEIESLKESIADLRKLVTDVIKKGK
jgi:hypothetical protein